MERLGCWQLLGPHRASRASTHFTPLSPPSVFLSAFSLWCLRIVMQSSPGRDGGVLLSLDVSKISCLRDAGLISGLSHHLRCAPHLWNMQSGILKPHSSQENLTLWLTFSNFPERWWLQSWLPNYLFVTMVTKHSTLSSVNCWWCVLH